MDFVAPAKLNLYLKVLRKIEDGYHRIDTLFERISLFDRISIDVINRSSKITCSDKNVPVGRKSLMGRAVALFREEAGVSRNFRIHVDKNIPVGAGLGGGSSDTAAILKGMNLLTGRPLKKQQLPVLGRRLGADIPFFISDVSFGRGTNRGDVIKKIDTTVKLHHIIINPGFEISTGEVYGRVNAFDLTKNGAIDRMVSAFSGRKRVLSIAKNLYNDLQIIVLRDFPVLKDIFAELKISGAKGVLVTGSGPTCFGVFEKRTIENAEKKLKAAFRRKKNWKIFRVSTF